MRCSASQYHGSAISNVRSEPTIHGRRRQVSSQRRLQTTQMNIGTPLSTKATGPFASSPRTRPPKKSIAARHVERSGCFEPGRRRSSSASQNPAIVSVVPRMSSMSVITAPVATKNRKLPEINDQGRHRRIAITPRRQPYNQADNEQRDNQMRQPSGELADAEQLEADRRHPERERRLTPIGHAIVVPRRDPVVQLRHFAADLAVAGFRGVQQRRCRHADETRQQQQSEQDRYGAIKDFRGSAGHWPQRRARRHCRSYVNSRVRCRTLLAIINNPSHPGGRTVLQLGGREWQNCAGCRYRKLHWTGAKHSRPMRIGHYSPRDSVA